jgi:hypothetical protein
LIKCYEQANPLDKDLVLRSFQSVLSELELKHGSAEHRSDGLRSILAKRLLKLAQNAASNPHDNIEGEMTRISANGVALLSYYIEMQALKSQDARALVGIIDEWSKRPSGYNPL